MFVINATDYAPVTPVTPPCDIIPIFIGYKGENHARCLIFDLTDCIEEFGDGGFAISFMRHGDAQPYIVTDTDQLDYTAIWEINATDTAVEGYGMVQLQYIVGETVCKTAMYRTVTFDSNESAGDVPDPYTNLLDQIAAYAALAQGSAVAAERAEVNAAAQADRIISTTADAVGDWLEDNIGEISGYVIDKSLTVSDAAADAKVAGDWIRASFITDTASGAVASFPDGADGVPVKDLTVSVQAVQSGTGDPSPNNVRAITGWTQANVVRCGKNMASSFSIGYIINASTGEIESASNANWISNRIQIGDKPFVVTIADKGNMGNGSVNIGLYKTDGTFAYQNVGYFSDTLPKSKTYSTGIESVILFGYQSGGVTAINTTKIQVEFGTAATAYEPYNGTTYTVSFGSAGTVYGGTLDVITGVLTVTHAKLRLGSFTFGGGNGSYFYTTVSNKKAGVTNIIADCYKTVNTSAVDMPNNSIKGSGGNNTIYIMDTSCSTHTELETALANNYFAYELATPQTYALTPQQITTLLGCNNIWADCGGSDVTYRADPRLYLAKLTNSDNDMIADANIVSGQYFTVGNQLYLATANIANGGAIIVGTNCALTNLAAALNAINS